MIYTNNGDIRKAFKMACLDRGILLKDMATNAGLTPQALNDIFLKRHITCDDIKRLANAVGLEFYFDLLPEQTEDSSTLSE